MADSEATVEELKQKVSKFCRERDWDQFHNPKDLSLGIVTEAAELVEHFRFRSEKEIEEFFKNPEKKHEISEELADVFWFVLRMAEKCDMDLSQSLQDKINKNEERYPVEKFKGVNKKYNEGTG